MDSSPTTTVATKHSTISSGANSDESCSVQDFNNLLGKDKKSSIKRFSQIHTIGLGGIGTVMSAYEEHLDRDLAIKMLRPAFRNSLNSVSRFIQEARATAHIAHPNIVPVYELGIFEDSGPFFTMKHVKGVTLHHILKRLDQKSEKYIKKYSLRSLLNIFIAICNGVAYAHSKNIIHRDLKPANIMLGDYGEVMVMDWGLVKKADHADEYFPNDPMPISQSASDIINTLDGEVTGTPAFMSPEQACGDNLAVDIQSDIYCLGAILCVILTKRRSPFSSGLKTLEILNLVANGRIIPPRKQKPKLKISKELNAITMKAMSHDKKMRYASVLDFISDIRNYLDNYPVMAYPVPLYIKFFKACKRRPMIPVTIAVAIFTLITAFGFQLYDQNERFNYNIKQASENINSGDLMYAKLKTVIKRLAELRKSNNKTDEQKIDALDKQRNQFEAFLDNYYNAAEIFLLKINTTGARLKEVNTKLGHIMKNKIYYSLMNKDFGKSKKLVSLMRLNKRAESYQQVRENDELYRKMNLVFYNEGIINIKTIPEGSEVEIIEILPIEPEDISEDRLEIKQLGSTPIKGFTLAAGSYEVTLYSENRPTITYPLLIEPGDIVNQKIYIPKKIPAGMSYIPAGAYYTEELSSTSKGMTRKTLAGFFIKKSEVTFEEYLRFWVTLNDPGEKQRYRSMLLLDKNSRRLAPAWDSSAKLSRYLKLQHPVCGISYKAAVAYCLWIARQRHRPCRLPSVDQWEKAARGVDGRKYVWKSEEQFKNILIPENQNAVKKYQFGAPTATFPLDVSVYGVLDMAGNVREYTSSLNPGSKNMFIVKGGSSRVGGSSVDCSFDGFAGRFADDIGLRYIMPLMKNQGQHNTANR